MATGEVRVSAEVRAALAGGRPVVALESTLIAHGLPYPVNRETAAAAEAAVREAGAVPATVAVWEGVPAVGLSPEQIDALATRTDVLKAARRDLGPAVALRKTAATTVSATMALARAAGVRVFATGGVGGVHRAPPGDAPSDVSADLSDLGRVPVLVVCAGAKNILDLPRTLEWLETAGVPVLGYRTSDFPAFYLAKSGLPVAHRIDSAAEAARAFAVHASLGGGGVLLARPVDAAVALTEPEWRNALMRAEEAAERANVRGPAVTPFLLARIAEFTGGKSLAANRALIVANARLAAETAVELERVAPRG